MSILPREGSGITVGKMIAILILLTVTILIISFILKFWWLLLIIPIVWIVRKVWKELMK